MALVLSTGPAPAQTPSAPIDARRDTLERVYRLARPIVVTASRSPQRVLEAPRSVESIAAVRIEQQQARTAPEALLEAEGVFVQSTNRGAGTPILRGLLGPQNLLLVDGVRFNTAIFRTGPNQYLSTIDPSALLRLEVVRGPSSVLYGEGAMGGVVQALTCEVPRTGCGVWGGQTSTWCQSADLALGTAGQLWGRSEKAAWLVGGSVSRFSTLRSAGGTEQPFSDFESGGWHAKGQWQMGSQWAITGAYLGTRLSDAGRTDQLGRGDLRFYDNDDHLSYVRLRRSGGLRPYTFSTTLSYHRSREYVERFDFKTNAAGTLADVDATLRLDPAAMTRQVHYTDVVDVIGGSSDIEWEFLRRRVRMQAGADIYEEFVSSERADAKVGDGFVFVPQPRGNFSTGSRYTTLGAFAHARARVADLGAGNLAVSAGLRASRFSAFAPNVPALGDVDDVFAGVVGSAGVQYLHRDRLNLYATAVQGFRAPNLQETTVLGNTGSKFEIPNGDLGPERSDMLEVGARLEVGRIRLATAWFYNMLEDVIDERSAAWNNQPVVDGKPVVQRVNAAEGLYRGIETSIALEVLDLTFSAAVAVMRGDIRSYDGVTYPARRIPPPFGTFGLRYEPSWRGTWGEFGLRWAGHQGRLHPSDAKDLRLCETEPFSGSLRNPCDGTPGWATLHLRGGWQINRTLGLVLALDNLTDQHYRSHGSGLDGPGFDLRSTLHLRF